MPNKADTPKYELRKYAKQSNTSNDAYNNTYK